MIPYGRQEITEPDIEAVKDVLKSDFLTQGPVVPIFEHKIASTVDAKHAIAVNSATSALHISCLALGLGPGDWLWTTPNTFVASANCGLYCGANVDFVDIDPKTLNMCVKGLENKLVSAEKLGKLPKVIIPVQFSGKSCDMERIHWLAKLYKFKVIEDASHAIGGLYQEQPIGSCKYSDITVFSFHPVKIITTGEGGVAVTNNEDLAKSMRRLRSHGITRDVSEMNSELHDPWYYEQIDLGFNYRMTDIQAALGLSQLQRLSDLICRRHEISAYYDSCLVDLPLKIPSHNDDCYSSLHLYVIRLNLDKLYKTRREIFDELRAAGIGVNVHYIPVHTQPFFQRLGFRMGDFPESEKYYSEAISLPIYPSMTEGDKKRVVSAVRNSIML